MPYKFRKYYRYRHRHITVITAAAVRLDGPCAVSLLELFVARVDDDETLIDRL